MSPVEQLFVTSMLIWTAGAQLALWRLRQPIPVARNSRADRYRTRA